MTGEAAVRFCITQPQGTVLRSGWPLGPHKLRGAQFLCERRPSYGPPRRAAPAAPRANPTATPQQHEREAANAAETWARI